MSPVSVLARLCVFPKRPETLLPCNCFVLPRRIPSRFILPMPSAVTAASHPSSDCLRYTELLLEHSEVIQGLQHNLDISAGPTWEQMCGSSPSPAAGPQPAKGVSTALPQLVACPTHLHMGKVLTQCVSSPWAWACVLCQSPRSLLSHGPVQTSHVHIKASLWDA